MTHPDARDERLGPFPGSAGPVCAALCARPHGRPLVGPYWFIVPAVVMLSTVYLGPMIYAMMASGTYWVLTEPGSENHPGRPCQLFGRAVEPDLLARGPGHAALRADLGRA